MAEKGVKKTRGQYFDDEMMEKAKKGQTYIKLGEKGGNLLLSGAAAKWKADPSFVYVPSLRVAGKPADIEKVFVDLELFAPAEIKQHIAAGYRSGEASQEYADELAALKAFKAKTKTAPKAAGTKMKHDIKWYADRIDEFTVESRPGSPKKTTKAKTPKKTTKAKTPKKAAKGKAKSRSTSPKRAKSASPKKRGPKPLADKVAKLSEGKVMDVSSYKASGEGANPIKEPTSRSKKIVVPGTRIASDNKRGINSAAKALDMPDLPERWEAARSGKAAASPKAASPKASGSPKSPAAQIKMPATSPIGGLSTVRKTPKATLPNLPKVATIGSPRGSPRL